jgi:hypothetical protein
MKGGDAIAVGSDGCIFAPRLTVTDIKGVRTAVPVKGGDMYISKIFMSKDIATNEYKLLRMIHAETGGEGTIQFVDDVEQFDVLEDTVKESLMKKVDGNKTICGLSKEDGVKYMIHMERIDSDLRDVASNSLTPDNIRAAWNALARLHDRREGGIFHLDLAARNIFIKNGNAILGDYGSGYMVGGSESFDTFVQRFVERYKIESIGDCITGFSGDGVGFSPEFGIPLLYYSDVYLRGGVPESIVNKYRLYINGDGANIYPATDYPIVPGLVDAINHDYWKKLEAMLGPLITMTREGLQAHIIEQMRYSDKDMFVQSTLSRLLVPMVKKEAIYKSILLNNNFDLFNTYVNPTAASLQARLAALRAGGGKTKRRHRSSRRAVPRRRKTVRRVRPGYR